MKITPPWGAYLCLQTDLATTTQINNHSWGLEAGLDAVLAAAAATNNASPSTNPVTTIATAERRERHRTRLRCIYQADLEPTVDQPTVVEARIELAQIRQHLPASDWHVISSVAAGMDYGKIAKNVGATAGSLRVRIMRLRQNLLSLAA